MSNTWDKAKSLADKHANQGGIFVRLANDGDKVVGAFCGEPFAREVVWTGERYETYDAANDAHSDKRPSLRVMLNFFVPAENAMKVIEGGTTWFKDVLKVRDKYGLEKWIFEIERHGEAGNPKTTYSILPEEKLTDELRAKLAAVEPHDLERLASGEPGDGAPSQPSQPARAAATGPIDPRLAGELVARLKSLPRTDVDAFLAKFGVQRVRDLRAADEAAARTFLDQLEAKQAPAAAPAEVDPFA
ncbi:MAG: hypothetical protein RBU45_08420 [Myxococcota bacterium]|jgi:hypothetical protein|nr:hypothetical protein [Myxococcota bacterium]